MVQFFSWRPLLLAGALMCVAPWAAAQDAPDAGDVMSSREAIALQNQVAALRQQLAQVQNAASLSPPTASGTAPSVTTGGVSGDLTAQLLQRVSALEEQNRQMRGEVDQLSNTLKTTQETLSKQISDMQFAAQNGAGAASGAVAGAATSTASSAVVTPKADSAPASDATPKTALEALHFGNAALRAGHYTEAESDARFAVKTAKSVQGRMDAQFLLAQSLAGQKQYRDSAVAYYDAYGKLPKSAKAQDSLLGVAASLIALGDKASACQALDKLKAEFPSPEARVKAAMATFRGRAACH
ncbi:tetratricopeptide repeat protein [Neokomagataea anthophila]|nr:tetratricopeptide repeat protein [Neokomagataea anthophila]